MKTLIQRVNELETKISIYSDRDQVHTKELELELAQLNAQLLDSMTLDSMLQRFEMFLNTNEAA
jgi:hypothetical protein